MMSEVSGQPKAIHISVNGATVALCICSGKPHTAKCRLNRWALRHVEQPRLNFAPEPPAQAIPVNPQFHGEGYVPALDQKRLSRHCASVLRTLRMFEGAWWTYEVLAEYSLVPPGSVRTRVSNLRIWSIKHKLGWRIEQRTRPDRFREVRLVEE